MTSKINSATRLTALSSTLLAVLSLSLSAPNPTKADPAVTIGSSSTASNTSGSTASSTNSTNGPNYSVVNSNSNGAATSGSGSSSTAISSIQGVNVTTNSSGNGTDNSGNGNGTGATGGTTANTPTNSSANSKITVSNEGTSSIRTAPAIAAPPLIATMTDNCMGSYSAGVSIVGFGATGGKTKVDEDCVRRLDAREFRALGMNDVAFALLLQGKKNHLAAEAANLTSLAPDK